MRQVASVILVFIPVLLGACVTTQTENTVPTPSDATAPQSAPDHAALSTRPEIEQALDRPVSIVLEDLLLADIFDFMTRTYGIAFSAEENVLTPLNAPAATIDYVNVRNMPLRDALRRVLRPMDLDYRVENDHISVLKRQNAAPGKRDLNSALRKDEAVDLALNASIQHMELRNVALSEALDAFREHCPVAIVVDTRAVKASGADTERMDYIEMKNVPARDCLAALLRPFRLAYSVREGYVLISSTELMSDVTSL